MPKIAVNHLHLHVWALPRNRPRCFCPTQLLQNRVLTFDTLRSCQESIRHWDPGHIHQMMTYQHHQPSLPNLALKGTSDRDGEGFREKEKDRKKREQSTAIALLAGQTLFKRLRGAFWDAFTTSTPSHTSSSSSPSSLTATKNRDIDGVWKVKFVVVVHI